MAQQRAAHPGVQDDVKVQQIREAARALFLQHGYAQVSTAALAKQAGISKETLYSRFPSKEAVLVDLLEHLLASGDPATLQVPQLSGQEDLERAFRQLAEALLAEITRRENVEIARIVIAEVPRFPHIGKIFRHSVSERALETVSTLLAAAEEAHLAVCEDRVAAARCFVGPLVVYTLMNVLFTASDDGEADRFDVDSHVALYLRAITPRCEERV